MDIAAFCRARILLDETFCDSITDAGLKESCLESIKIKKSWIGGAVIPNQMMI